MWPAETMAGYLLNNMSWNKTAHRSSMRRFYAGKSSGCPTGKLSTESWPDNRQGCLASSIRDSNVVNRTLDVHAFKATFSPLFLRRRKVS